MWRESADGLVGCGEAVVAVVEPRGSGNDVHLVFAVQVANEDTMFTMATRLRTTAESGTEVVIRNPGAAIDDFDAGAGEALHHRTGTDVERRTTG